MKTPVTDILLVVSSRVNDVALAQLALNLARDRFCVIHLLSVIQTGIPGILSRRKIACQEMSEIGSRRFIKHAIRLSEIKAMIERRSKLALVKAHICTGGGVTPAIIWNAGRFSVQAIVMSNRFYDIRFPFLKRVSGRELAEKANCAVLMYHRGVLSMHEKNDPFAFASQDRGHIKLTNLVRSRYSKN